MELVIDNSLFFDFGVSPTRADEFQKYAEQYIKDDPFGEESDFTFTPRDWSEEEKLEMHHEGQLQHHFVTQEIYRQIDRLNSMLAM